MGYSWIEIIFVCVPYIWIKLSISYLEVNYFPINNDLKIEVHPKILRDEYKKFGAFTIYSNLLDNWVDTSSINLINVETNVYVNIWIGFCN